METMDVSQLNQNPEIIYQVHSLIVPTVMIPLTIVSVILSATATFVAGLFGIQLKAEGPKRLLEVLLKPKVIVLALLFNALVYGAVESYQYIADLPAFEFRVSGINKHLATESASQSFKDYFARPNQLPDTSTKNHLAQKIQQSWTKKLPMGAFRAPAMSGESLFISSDDGHVYELSHKDGAEIRKFYVGTPVTPSSTIWNNQLFVGEGLHDTHHARIYAFDLKTGKYLRSFTTKGHTEAQPVIGTHNERTLLFAAAGKDGLYALDPTTMKKVWHDLPGHIDAAVRVENGIVYVSTGREKNDLTKDKPYAIAYEFATGKIVWKKELAASGWMEPVLTDNDVCFILGEIYFKSDYGQLACFDKKSGDPSWALNLTRPLIGIPMKVGKNLYVSDLYGKVCKISIDQRKFIWCNQVQNEATKTFTSVSYDIKKGVLLYPTSEEGLSILEPKTGQIIQKWMPSKADGPWKTTFASVGITDEGWILSDIDGNIRHLKIDPN